MGNLSGGFRQRISLILTSIPLRNRGPGFQQGGAAARKEFLRGQGEGSWGYGSCGGVGGGGFCWWDDERGPYLYTPEA